MFISTYARTYRTPTRLTLNFGANIRVQSTSTESIMLRPDSEPRRFPGLPGLRNGAACLPGPARAPTRLPSPAPNPPDKRHAAQQQARQKCASAAVCPPILHRPRMKDTTAAATPEGCDARTRSPLPASCPGANGARPRTKSGLRAKRREKRVQTGQGYVGDAREAPN